MAYYPSDTYSQKNSAPSAPPNNGWTDYSAMPTNAHPGLAEVGGNVGQGSPPKNILFDDRVIRAAFIRKVFTTVAIMLSIVAVMTAWPKLHTNTGLFLRRNGDWLGLLFFAIFAIVYFTLVCCKKARRTYPMNIILTGLFTVVAGAMSMVITARFDVESVLMALIITIISCTGVVFYAAKTKRDLTGWIAVMAIISLVFCAFGFVVAIAVGVYHVQFVHAIYSLVGALIMMGWLALDVQLLIGGNKLEISPEDHIFIAVQLFIDILYVFWHILEAIGTDDQ